MTKLASLKQKYSDMAKERPSGAESEKVREELRTAKSSSTSQSSENTDRQQPPPVPQDDVAAELDRNQLYPASVQSPVSAQFQRR